MTLLSKRVFYNRFQFLVREDLVIIIVKMGVFLYKLASFNINVFIYPNYRKTFAFLMKLSAIRKVAHRRNYIIEFCGPEYLSKNIFSESNWKNLLYFIFKNTLISI